MRGSMDVQATTPAGTEEPATVEARAAEEAATAAEARAAEEATTITRAPAAEEAAEVEESPTVNMPAIDGASVGVSTPAAAETPAAADPTTIVDPPAGTEIPAEPRAPGFRERGQMRRRLRFLRKARELAYRDLGGLVFEIYRQSERRDELVAAKVEVLRRLDEELRALETALETNSPITVLREAGVAACPKCAAIHGSGDRFCPACGLSMDRHADRPITGTPVQAPTAPAAPPPRETPEEKTT
jgi:hypothetical protein